MGVFPYGVFGTPRDMMEHLTTLWISIWEWVAGEVPIAHIHIWEDMSGKQGRLSELLQ